MLFNDCFRRRDNSQHNSVRVIMLFNDCFRRRERFSRGEFSTQLSKSYAHCIVYVVTLNVVILIVQSSSTLSNHLILITSNVYILLIWLSNQLTLSGLKVLLFLITTFNVTTYTQCSVHNPY